MGTEKEDTDDTACSNALVARALTSLFIPRREVTVLLDFLRQHPETRVLLDRAPQSQSPTVDPNETSQPLRRASRTQQENDSSREHDLSALPLVVDYANGLSQAEIALKHGIHIQTVRKRLKEVGVGARRRNTLTDEELTQAPALLEAGISAREVGRRLGVAHTTVLRAIRHSKAVLHDDEHHRAPSCTIVHHEKDNFAASITMVHQLKIRSDQVFMHTRSDRDQSF